VLEFEVLTFERIPHHIACAWTNDDHTNSDALVDTHASARLLDQTHQHRRTALHLVDRVELVYVAVFFKSGRDLDMMQVSYVAAVYK
jgi:hypothetical protein